MRWIFGGLIALLSSSEAAMAQSPPRSRAAVAAEQHRDLAAREAPHPWRERPFALDAMLGIAHPLGLVGVSAEYAPIEYVSLGGGVGSNLLGWQLAGMARARFTPEARGSFYVGGGYSQGRHIQAEGTRDGVFSLFLGPLTAMGHDRERGHDWHIARWLNAELGAEQRRASGFDLRGFVGFAFLLNPNQGVPAPPDNSQSRLLPVRDWMLYAGTALGFAL